MDDNNAGYIYHVPRQGDYLFKKEQQTYPSDGLTPNFAAYTECPDGLYIYNRIGLRETGKKHVYRTAVTSEFDERL